MQTQECIPVGCVPPAAVSVGGMAFCHGLWLWSSGLVAFSWKEAFWLKMVFCYSLLVWWPSGWKGWNQSEGHQTRRPYQKATFNQKATKPEGHDRRPHPRADPPRSRQPQSRHPPGSRHPPRADPLEADVPWKQTSPQEQTPPLGADTHPGTDTPRSRHPPWSSHPLGADTPSLVNRILDTRLWKYYLAPNFICGR